MEVPETFFEIVFNIVRAQNDALLREIALKEDIPARDLLRTFSTSKRALREFLNKVNRPNPSP